MEKIKLNANSWEYDPNSPLGPEGGFGAVFLGKDNDGEDIAVKKLHLSAHNAGNREFSISEELSGNSYNNIIPFYDSGIDAESGGYFVVMAKAENSLQDLITDRQCDENEAISILNNIVNGLIEVDGIIHRDLKPGNVLLHDNQWKLADFGIARFVENSTSMNTLKDYLSPQYAAPEQWRYERASKATDVYALGCIATVLVTGQPPFASGDFRERHLHEKPTIPKSISARFQQLISMCLRKNPNARPSLESIRKQLDGMEQAALPHSSLVSAGASIAEQELKTEAEQSRKQTVAETRKELASDALESLNLIIEMLFDRIETDAPVAKRIHPHNIILGQGVLSIKIPFPSISEGVFNNSNKNIICGAFIKVEQSAGFYKGRSANLWFEEISKDKYRWVEIPYWTTFQQTTSSLEPYGVVRHSELADVDYAMSSVMHSVNQAAQSKLIDGEYTQDFIDRWSERLALASSNQLQRQSPLPER